jgi:hypothetical protein
MTYVLKYKDEHGDWFYSGPRRWSDNFADAFRFKSESKARDEALASASRIKACNGFDGAARVRVVSMRAGS